MLCVHLASLIVLIDLNAGASADAGAPVDGGALMEGTPEYVSGRDALEAYDLERKHQGFYVTPLPLVDSDPDTGFGAGAQAFAYWNGARSDPLFSYEPYQHRLTAQVLVTTNGFQQETLDWDAPYIFDTPFRARAEVYYEKNTSANYFGRGDSTLQDLGFTAGGPTRYSSFAAYSRALEQVRPGDVAFTLYNKFSEENPTLDGSLERSLLGGLVRAQVGVLGQHVTIGDLTDRPTYGIDPSTGKTLPATMGVTRLREDCGAGLIVGCSGGWHNLVKLGVAFDSRDFEPDPNAGVFADLTTELSSRIWGSGFDYVRVTGAVRGFYSPVPRWADVVIAGRAVYSAQTRGTPFFAMDDLGFTDEDRAGLGGLWTLRGFQQDRFVGAIDFMANLEVRWTFANFKLFTQDWGLQFAPFVDVGRVFDRVAETDFLQWQDGEGVSLHVLWNKSTVISVDYGFSRGDQGLYMDFGEQF